VEDEMPRTTALAHATRIEPTDSDHEMLLALDRDEAPGRLVLRAADGHDIELPEVLVTLVRAATHILAHGDILLAVSLETRLTPNEAAEMLGVSRPFLLRLIDDGHLPAENLPGSTHRHLRLTDILEFQGRREQRRTATERISSIVEEHDLPY
jgi:excisionase family DNA binding protein